MIDDYLLTLQTLPPELEGMRIAHLSDLHVTRQPHYLERLYERLVNRRIDLICLTGDYMNDAGDEPAAIPVVGAMLKRMQPRLGVFGTFGNHDTQELRDGLADANITWLNNESRVIENLPLEVIGIHCDRGKVPDSVEFATSIPVRTGSPLMRLLLCHYPDWFHIAADMSVDLMLSGHTHGGQIRLPGGLAMINHSDLPLSMSSGLLRQGGKLCAISRGMGEVAGPWLGWRFACSRQLPVYTLRRGPLAGHATNRLQRAMVW